MVSGSELPSQSSENISHSPLMAQARARMETLPLETLLQAGMTRDRRSYFLNIAYPSMQAMPQVTAENVYPPTKEKENGRKLALYVHIPFCTAECYYCHYFKEFHRSDAEVERYLQAVLQELQMHVQHFGGIEAASVYFGGGTPSYVRPDLMDAFLRQMREMIDIPPGTEFSFEIHPESCTEELLAVLQEHGVNRINIGVESFDDTQLKSENRRHTAEEAEAAFQRVQAAGFSNVNLDLIYGLRGQTSESWERTLQTIGRLQPASTTMYYLRLKHSTPEYNLWKKYPEQFPSDEQLLLMHIMNFEFMEKQLGYVQNPVDWFIRDQSIFHDYQDHNWRRSDEVGLLGLGASAYSYVDGWQYYNSNQIASYQDALSQGELPIWKGEFLTGDEPLRRTIMMGIKMGIERKAFASTYGVDPLTAFAETWQFLEQLGLVEVTNEKIELTYLGKLHADEVGQQFYSETMKQRMAAIDPVMVSTTWPHINR